jgi:hypothetical protein
MNTGAWNAARAGALSGSPEGRHWRQTVLKAGAAGLKKNRQLIE